MSAYSFQKASRKSWIVWFFAVLFYFYEFMIQVSPGVMAQDLMHDFNIRATGLGNLSAYYFYSYASMQLVVGILLDSWGPRKLLSLSSVICAVGCYLFAHADGLLQAELSRLLIGAGSACAVISSFKLSTSWFPSQYFGIMTGLTVMTGMLGAIFGEVPLSWAVHSFGWRHSMLGFSIGGIILSILIWTIVHDAPDVPTNQMYSEKSNGESSIWTVLKNRQTWLTSIYGGLMFAPTTALGALWGVSWMCTYYSLDRSAAAHIISFLFLGWAVGSPLSGVLANYFGRCKVTMQGGTILSFIIICLLIFVNSWSTTSLKLLWFAFGFSSSGFLPFMTLIRKQHSYQTAGTAMGFGNGMNMVGGALLQPIIGLFLDQSWEGTIVDGVRIYSSDGYINALIIVPVLIAISYVILLMIKEESRVTLTTIDNSSKSQQIFSDITNHGGKKMIRNLMILFTFGSCLTLTAHATDLEAEPAGPEQEQCKLYAVVDESLSEGLRANAIGHMAIGLGSVLFPEALRPTPYVSADGVMFRHISECPFIVLKGNSSKLRQLYEGVVADGTIPHVEFLETMHLGPTFREQIEATRAKPAVEIKILGIALFGSSLKLKPLLRRFSLLR